MITATKSEQHASDNTDNKNQGKFLSGEENGNVHLYFI
jgi:hypothetical protein